MADFFMDTILVNRVLQEAEQEQSNTLKLLEELVNIDSYSFDKRGVEQLFPLLETRIDELAFSLQRIPQEEYADQLWAEYLPDTTRTKIVLLVHLDTVFPGGTAKIRPFTIDQEQKRAYGPGIADMKGGVAITLAALRILKRLNVLTMPIGVLFTGDEEIGSPISAPVIEKYAKNAAACLVMEPGRADGSVVIQRKGSGHGIVRIKGKASHSGVAFTEGISANLELAHKILAIDRLNAPDAGLTVNSGIIRGGTSANMVSPESEIHLHFAFDTLEGAEELMEKCAAIVSTPDIPGTCATISLRKSCLPMEQTAGNRQLFSLAQDCARSIGFALRGTATKGASDAGRSSALGVPTICGMGPVGGGYHSEEEYIELDSVCQRTALLALTIVAASEKMKQLE